MKISRHLLAPLVGALLAVVGCGTPAEPAPSPYDVPFNMKYGYLDHARGMGAAGITDEQLLTAGMYVCSNFGPDDLDAATADRQAAWLALVDDEQDLIPDEASGPTVTAILTGTSFLCSDDGA